MQTILNDKKYKQKVIEFEEFIDDCYADETFALKILFQSSHGFNNAIDDFFRFKYLLV